MRHDYMIDLLPKQKDMKAFMERVTLHSQNIVSVPHDMDCFMPSKLQKTFQRNMNGSQGLSGQDGSVKTRS